ncbi:hypothetical protein HPP92_013858 [Vanilla planifolia]|uniref:Uncharacterized protein n=1 Tax=Vanilla planifolia TaxID=51239 RepID=A0A835UX46_VANPL|nr:hypothetical protein HPP92_013858 [Vanilla planifolia]
MSLRIPRIDKVQHTKELYPFADYTGYLKDLDHTNKKGFSEPRNQSLSLAFGYPVKNGSLNSALFHDALSKALQA